MTDWALIIAYFLSLGLAVYLATLLGNEMRKARKKRHELKSSSRVSEQDSDHHDARPDKHSPLRPA